MSEIVSRDFSRAAKDSAEGILFIYPVPDEATFCSLLNEQGDGFNAG
jgi:hypothetical protein